MPCLLDCVFHLSLCTFVSGIRFVTRRHSHSGSGQQHTCFSHSPMQIKMCVHLSGGTLRCPPAYSCTSLQDSQVSRHLLQALMQDSAIRRWTCLDRHVPAHIDPHLRRITASAAAARGQGHVPPQSPPLLLRADDVAVRQVSSLRHAATQMTNGGRCAHYLRMHNQVC